MDTKNSFSDKRVFKIVLSIFYNLVNVAGPAKWISKWRGHETLKSIVGHHDWPTRKFFEF